MAEPGPQTELAECSNSSAQPQAHNLWLFWPDLSHKGTKGKPGESIPSWHSHSSLWGAGVVPAQGWAQLGDTASPWSARVAEQLLVLSPALLPVTLPAGPHGALAAARRELPLGGQQVLSVC